MQHLSNLGRPALGALLLSCLALAGPAGAADEPQFPAVSASYLKTGDFMDPDQVRQVAPGLNKDQVRLRLGNPHFSEGIFAVYEWDYVFNFYTGKAHSDYVTCQFKVKFDQAYRVTATYWKGEHCADSIAVPVAAPVAVALPAPLPAVASPSVAPRRRVVLAADGVFAFGKSGLGDLVASGRDKLDALVGQMRQGDATVASVVVTGNTDRIGSTAENQALSQARAETVRAYLVNSGVDSTLVQAHGVGESQPVVACPGAQVTPQLVACLQANRRVEVEFIGVQ